jgi:cytoskeletal protein CcmA (bactofilin family)
MGKEEINAFLGAATVYTGKLNFQGVVRIDGVFNGEIESEGMLIVGKDARIEGRLHVNELVLSGNFIGEAAVAHRATIHKTGVFTGTMHAKALVLEEGAMLEGEIHMRNAGELRLEA